MACDYSIFIMYFGMKWRDEWDKADEFIFRNVDKKTINNCDRTKQGC